ncbi:MAG: hypothetical protein CMO55_13970 [Verrucomicrobiales bacterium]|nr:hypothetical protein [Verrucomicrobiales bacterium]
MSTPDSHDDSTANRDRSIRLAIVTSLISKVGTIVLRLVSIPIAISQFGMELFGVYAAITLAVGMIDMFHIGIGPALTREISRAVAKKDRERETTVFSTSILLSTGLSLLMGAIAAALLIFIPIPDLFGDEFAPVAEIMQRAAWIGLSIMVLEMICATFEMGRDGYQETRFNNSWGAAGNVVAAVALLTGIWYFPTIEFLLLAVNGSIVLAKLGNTIHLLIQRPYLIPKFSLFKRKLVRPLAFDGFRFSITYILAAMIEYNMIAFVIGRVIGPEAVGVYSVMITVHFSLTNVVGMITRPYWPALMDAYERNDEAWITKTSRRLSLGGIAFGIATTIGLVALGPILLPLWAGEELKTDVSSGFELTRMTLLAFSAYFTLHIWRHINQVFALGVGWVSQVAWTVVAEGLLLLGLGTMIVMTTGNLGTLYAAMAGTLVLFSGWLFPLFFKKGRTQTPEPPVMEEELVHPVSSPL